MSQIDSGMIPQAPRAGAKTDPMDLIRGTISDFLNRSGQNAEDVKARMDQFLATIQPDVEQAMLDGDVMSLGYLRDRVFIQLGRASLGALYRERQIISETVVAVVRTLITIGIGLV